MATVRCYDVQGNAVSVAADEVTFRPAVFGIFIENNQVLLMRHPQTELLYPPGKILAGHETPTQRIRHYFRELTGMAPLLGPLLFVEDQYRVDDEGQAWHLSALYYALDRPAATATTLTEAESTKKPEWIALAELQRSKLLFGFEAIKAGQLRLNL